MLKQKGNVPKEALNTSEKNAKKALNTISEMMKAEQA